ncbi:MAG: hypothetical protein BMS9Abin05_0757 [Rhodothermia bacterium]|nr:MAG: hypothetical protein BMS9Abin05_0757 [Rhodothermia bacterium]
MRGPSCEDVNQFLCEYMEGTLPEKTQTKFQAHLSNCRDCFSYFEQYKATIELLNEQDDISVPNQLVEHTLEFLKANISSN